MRTNRERFRIGFKIVRLTRYSPILHLLTMNANSPLPGIRTRTNHYLIKPYPKGLGVRGSNDRVRASITILESADCIHKFGCIAINPLPPGPSPRESGQG